ncbi:uncharacterized protein BO95DRAFT_459407 [Aspergillus brunneoviolaceus CBS 621.78]|uniref:Uncharacterized protein n=1 Tax=Aspergillus brunneoviolaceus CBS 621.78 TaxID=1450534 RepID=A0ACD1GM93_9EURO|nr:hypothetical protein BO95DRAFT_459407 [Aspergillus brunneoviolaceus CBS 621.78]RAH50367.1 hypothetical protein BO95DRAFT_459407 [Aspergillus brunneoviolaceus CBS 621.78]
MVTQPFWDLGEEREVVVVPENPRPIMDTQDLIPEDEMDAIHGRLNERGDAVHEAPDGTPVAVKIYLPAIIVVFFGPQPSPHVAAVIKLLEARAVVFRAESIDNLVALVEAARDNIHGIILADPQLMTTYGDAWKTIKELASTRKYGWPFILAGSAISGAARYPLNCAGYIRDAFGVRWRVNRQTPTARAERKQVLIRGRPGETAEHAAVWLTDIPKADQIAIEAMSPNDPQVNSYLLTPTYTATSVMLHSEKKRESEMPVPLVGWIGIVNNPEEEAKWILRLCQLEYGFTTSPPRRWPDYTVSFEPSDDIVPVESSNAETEA